MENVKVDRIIFTTALLLLIIVCIPLVVFPKAGADIVKTVFDFITLKFGVVYLWSGVACLGFLFWLSFSKYGNIVLGFEGEKPQFSLYSWVSMLFCAGVATGILYWGTIEWAYYYESPPYGAQPRSFEAIEWASTYGMFHWGLTGWAFYALPTVAIGYFYYIRKVPYMRLSTSCYGILSHHSEGLIGRIIDITFMVGLIGATATSLGLGTPMIAEGLNKLGLSKLCGIESPFWLNVAVVLVVTAIFATTVYIGLEKGIKRLADINMALAIFILIFVLTLGPTIFLLKTGTNSIGIMFQNFIRMSTWTDPMAPSNVPGFVEQWTVFYWAWWIAVGPFMGIFLAEISRGRTIRQIVLGSLLFGSFGCAIYYIILGNYALHLELNNIISVTGIMAEKGAPAAIISVIASLPLSKIILSLFCIVSVIFMATTYNSSSYALASCASSEIKKGQSPARWHRLFWAIALAALPLALMFIQAWKAGEFKRDITSIKSDSQVLIAAEKLEPLQLEVKELPKMEYLDSLKTASLVVSLPLLVVFVLMAVSLAKALKEDDRTASAENLPETKRAT